MTHTFKLKPFLTPNFALLDLPPVTREAGLTSNSGSIPLKDLSDDALFGLCETFLTAVYKKAEKKNPFIVK